MNIGIPILSLLCIITCTSCGLLNHSSKHKCTEHASKPEESCFLTQGNISFKRQNNEVIALIKPIEKQQASSIYWPRDAISYKSVDTTKTYQLHFLRSYSGTKHDNANWISSTVIKISDDERVIYDASICPVHGDVMERKYEQEMTYEFYYPYRKIYFEDTRPRRFPNDGKVYLTCDAGIEHMTWRCPTCYKLSEDWRIKHGID